MMDDMTYSVLKQYSHLIPITYFSVHTSLFGGSAEDQLQAYRALFKKVPPIFAAMRCVNFSVIGLNSISQKLSLCCVKL